MHTRVAPTARAGDDHTRIPRGGDGGRRLCAAVCGLSGGADLGRRVARLCIARACGRADELGAARCAAPAHVRRDDQRGAARDPALHLHGRDAGARQGRRGPARDHGAAVRIAARRPRHLGSGRGGAVGGGQRRGRRHHRHHGVDRAADHAAPRLRPAAGRRHRRGDRDTCADLSARDRAGAALRSDEQRLSGGAAVAGRVRAALGHSRRSVRRRDRAGFGTGCALSALSRRSGRAAAANVPGARARSRRAAGRQAGATAAAGAVRTCAARPCRPRLGPGRRRHRDRGCVGGRGRGDPARPRQAWAQGLRQRAHAGGGAHHAGDQHDLPDPDRRDHVQPGVPRARRRCHGRAGAYRSPRRGSGRRHHGHGRDVSARLRDGCVRDHLRGGADRGAGVAQNAEHRSGLARGDDGGQPADLLPAPAARADAVLPARRGAPRDHHPAHLCRRYSIRADPSAGAGRALVRAGACDRPAAQALWRVTGHGWSI